MRLTGRNFCVILYNSRKWKKGTVQEGGFLFGANAMPRRPRVPCNYPGCHELIEAGQRYCARHKRQEQKRYDDKRGTAAQRGYGSRWRRYSKWFLRQPGNQICKLRLDDGCAFMADCVDHIKPPNGKDDPLFWEPSNHQASCIHCNSVKGRRAIEGKAFDWWRQG